MDRSTYQFSCPQCSSLLQAMLKQELTSVQCGECLDVFDVQMPALDPTAQPACTLVPAQTDPKACMPSSMLGAAPMNGAEVGIAEEQRLVKQRRINEPVAAGPPAPDGNSSSIGHAAAATTGVEDESTTNLEASLQSCTAHRHRILQMLVDDPDNSNLKELRDQLSNAISQLQGTKSMVQRATASNGRGGGLPGLASAAAAAGALGAEGSAVKSHSSRKNKPQRCSVCGGVGHKSRTCSMAVQQQHPAAQPQWTSAASSLQYMQQQSQHAAAALHPPGLPQPGLPQPGLPQPGLPQPGLPQPGYPSAPQMEPGCGGYMMTPRHPQPPLSQQQPAQFPPVGYCHQQPQQVPSGMGAAPPGMGGMPGTSCMLAPPGHLLPSVCDAAASAGAMCAASPGSALLQPALMPVRPQIQEAIVEQAPPMASSLVAEKGGGSEAAVEAKGDAFPAPPNGAATPPLPEQSVLVQQ